MSADLLNLDRFRLRSIRDADPTGYLGTLSTPGQACKAVFLAAEVGAITWNTAQWPELTFGVWSDSEVAETQPSRRRRRSAEADVAELSTWIQLQPSWPQLGGASIPWPIDESALVVGTFESRLDGLVAAAVDALNTIHRRTTDMARTLAGAVVPHPALTSPLTTNGSRPPSTAAGRRTFTAAGVATSEDEIAHVLAGLARNAEADAAHQHEPHSHGVVAHLGHAITVLPNGSGLMTTNGNHGRFLVTLTATIDPPEI